MLRPGITTLLIAVLFLSGCAMVDRTTELLDRTAVMLGRAADPPDGTLNAAEIRALFSDKTVKSVTFSRGTVRETFYMASGELRRLRKGQVSTGSWWVRKDGRLCQQIGEHEESCRAIVRTGNTYVKYVVRKDGNHRPVARYLDFRPGNPLNL